MYTFVFMGKKVMVIRPDIRNADLIEKLQERAAKKNYSLNKYVVLLLAEHVKKKK